MQQISDKEFYPFIKKNKLAIIDFWAERCPACLMLSPVLEQLAKDKEFKSVVFAKLDVDENHEVASKFSIMAIPTLLIFKDGRMIDQITGFLPKEALKKRLEKFL
ncbi:thioredoxin [Candidatus Pacearchaeota archaeon CG06_land_8_20_14_3_00_35_12]|nr:MAG: thioredoxin [Candidatus Pacearchaeota archaeon CG06_land_8_20_14_3_00_35_12]